MKNIVSAGKAVRALLVGASLLFGASHAQVIEIATFKLKPNVSLVEFSQLDKAVELEHVAKQPGFIARESAYTEDGKWLVIVHWRSMEAAQDSMNSFSSAPAASEFMEQIMIDSMRMTRYQSTAETD